MTPKNRCSQLSKTIIIAIAGGFAELCLGIALPTERAITQIIPDNTLGTENSAIAPKDKKSPHFTLIEGGAIRGSNLFHSFSHFNVNEESSVYFANPTGIDNIITRVTGNSNSKIFGTLGVNGTANLFLINPNGIIFGHNAHLDIRGSFFATTADSLIFQDGSKFSATHPEAPPLLTINVTPGLQYNNSATTAIANSGDLSAKQNLTLAAGNLNLSGKLAAGGNLTLQALDTIRIRDSIDRPFIAAAGGNLLVQGDRAVDIFALNHRDSGFYSGKDTIFRSANSVIGDAHYSTGGNFRIEQLNGSFGILESPNDPIIRSQGDVSFYGYQGTSLHIIAGGAVNINTIIITGAETGILGVDFIKENIVTSSGQTISIDGSARPTLDIRAGVNIAAIGTPGVTGYNFPTDIFFNSALTPVATPSTAASATSADINIGRIQSNAANSQVFLTTQYQPNTTLSGGSITVNNTGLFGGGIKTSSGSGNGGSIVIDSRSDINIIGNIDTSSSTGNSGSITLVAQKDITSTSNISSFSNTGNAGSINFNAGNILSVAGTVNASTLNAAATGNAGNINIIANSFKLQNSGSIITNSTGSGQSGNLDIKAQSVTLTGNGSFNSGLLANTTGSGNAGNLTINSTNLTIENAAIISATSTSTGNSGKLNITATSTTIDNSKLLVETAGNGQAGTISINSSQLNIQNNAKISANTFGNGAGGSITLNTGNTGTINIKNGGQVNAATSSYGQAGNVNIITGQLNIQNDPGQTTTGGIYVNTDHAGQAGNINIDATAVNLNRGFIFANNYRDYSASLPVTIGTAGNITVNTNTMTISNGSYISAASQSESKGGTITVNAASALNVVGTNDSTLNNNFGKPSTFLVGGFQSGDGGELQINTRQLTIKDGGLISGTAYDSGKAGNIIVNASDSIEITGSGPNASSSLVFETAGSGNAGNINLTTKKLLIQDGGNVSAQTISSGNAGTLNITADDVTISGTSTDGRFNSRLFFQSSGSGNAGGIKINSQQLTVQDGGIVSVSGTGTGVAGDIEINTGSIYLNNQGKINATTLSGEGGNIRLQVTDSIILRHNSEISTEAQGTGNGGNININAGKFVLAILSENSDIVANAFQGKGGNINANATGIFGFRRLLRQRTTESDFTASSALGVNGNVTINTRSVPNLNPLPDKLVDPQLNYNCNANLATNNPKATSQFVNTGKGGLPTNPGGILNNSSIEAPWVDLSAQEPSNSSAVGSPPNSSQPIVEAQGFTRNSKGEILLSVCTALP